MQLLMGGAKIVRSDPVNVWHQPWRRKKNVKFTKGTTTKEHWNAAMDLQGTHLNQIFNLKKKKKNNVKYQKH